MVTAALLDALSLAGSVGKAIKTRKPRVYRHDDPLWRQMGNREQERLEKRRVADARAAAMNPAWTPLCHSKHRRPRFVK